jgi:hypothetical protein
MSLTDYVNVSVAPFMNTIKVTTLYDYIYVRKPAMFTQYYFILNLSYNL